MKYEIPIYHYIVSIIFWLAIMIGVFSVTGCQSASVALDSAGAIRNQVAKKETEVHVQGLCGSNFNVVREMFGKNDQDWRALLTICGSDSVSIERE